MASRNVLALRERVRSGGQCRRAPSFPMLHMLAWCVFRQSLLAEGLWWSTGPSSRICNSPPCTCAVKGSS
eukprot:634332-Pyramimonas_sp.AAC.1